MRKYRYFIVIFWASLVLDRITKAFFVERPDTKILGEWVRFHTVYNQGIAFSFPIHDILLKILTLGLTLGIGYYFLCKEDKKDRLWMQIGYASLLSGAVSHTYDRIVFGKVLDFIDVKYFAIFNVADIMISVGAIILILNSLLDARNRNHLAGGIPLTTENR